jgi:hypothetical protein
VSGIIGFIGNSFLSSSGKLPQQPIIIKDHVHACRTRPQSELYGKIRADPALVV